MEIRQKAGRVNTSVSASERTYAEGVEESQVHLVRSGQILRKRRVGERKEGGDRQTDRDRESCRSTARNDSIIPRFSENFVQSIFRCIKFVPREIVSANASRAIGIVCSCLRRGISRQPRNSKGRLYRTGYSDTLHLTNSNSVC